MWCPRPDFTIHKCVENVKRGGFQNIYVSTNYQYGVLENFFHSYDIFFKSNMDWILTVENDVRFCPSAYKKVCELVSSIDTKDLGYISLYSPKLYERKLHKPGWSTIKLGTTNIAGQATLTHRDRLPEILSDKRWDEVRKAHRVRDKSKGGGDTVKSIYCDDNNLKVYYHNPSLAEHLCPNNGIITTKERPHHVGLNYNDNLE